MYTSIMYDYVWKIICVGVNNFGNLQIFKRRDRLHHTILSVRKLILV